VVTTISASIANRQQLGNHPARFDRRIAIDISICRYRLHWGSLISHGGQNVLEPAAQGVCVITGPHTHNFAAITRTLLAEDALIQLPKIPLDAAAAALARVINELLSDETRRKAIGKRAQGVCNQNRGATRETVEMIVNLLQPASTAAPTLPLPAVELAAK